MRSQRRPSKQRRVGARSTTTAGALKPPTARLIIDANCTTCGLIDTSENPFNAPDLAMEHVAQTGHVVILNGTVDCPGSELVA